MKDRKKLLAALAICYGVAAVGSLSTLPEIPTWYAELAKPAFTPPNWLFGPVWTLLYTLMAVALYLVWRTDQPQRESALGVFALQLGLNLAWSVAFFGLHWPELALVIIVLLGLAIGATMRVFWRISRPATYLLVPYLLWVGFAGALNAAIAALN